MRIRSLVVVALLTAPGVATAAPDPATVGREADRALGRGHQRDLPGFDAEAGGQGGGGGERGGERGGGRAPDESAGGEDGSGAPTTGHPRSRDRDRHLGRRSGRRHDGGDRAESADGARAPTGPLSGLATMLLWALVLTAAVVIALGLYRQIAGYTGEDAPAPSRKRTDEQLAAVIERPRDDADELAARGQFADAIHTLLLRTLHELASQNLVRVTPAMTSREILARVALLGDARDALSGLIIAVEQTWFGDDVPQLEDYQRCRAQFDHFAAAYRRGAGAAGAAA